MKVILNGKAINYFDDDVGILRDLFLHLSVHFPFQSMEAVKTSISELFNMVLEEIQIKLNDFKKSDSESEKIKLDKKKTSLLLRKINKFLKFIDGTKTKDALINRVFNFILSLEGLNTLPGFGFYSKEFSGKMYGNPEIKSLYK